MDYWAKPGLDRLQALLFYPTLDDSVSRDHPVRALEEILRGLDWTAWTQEYNGRVGQPAIPPWVMAGVILYGLMRRIRSSRQLEYACGNNIFDSDAQQGRRLRPELHACGGDGRDQGFHRGLRRDSGAQ